jgi:hypothetical protein
MRTSHLRAIRRFSLIFTLLGLLAGMPTLAGNMAGPGEGLVTLEDAGGWFVALDYEHSDREVNFDRRVTPIELSRLTAAVGVELLPFLTLRAQAGTVETTVGLIESSGGFEWGVGVRAALWDFIIDGTPVVPRRHAVRIEVDVDYRDASMEIDGVYFGPILGDPALPLAHTDDYLKWTELTITPLIRYTHNRATESVWNHRYPTGVSVYVGPHYSDWELEHDPIEGDGNSDFGMRLGADLRGDNGWLLQLEATLYGGTDDSYSIGMGYYF